MEVIGLLPPLVYFVVVWAKGSLSLVDAAVLTSTYVAYLWVLLKMPAARRMIEQDEEMPRVSRWALSFKGWKRWAAVGSLLLGGGVAIFLVAEPFLDFDDWPRGHVSGSRSSSSSSGWRRSSRSFPEKTSAFAWARRVTRAPVALMNMVSSNINQWGVLSALLAVIYCWSNGDTAPLPFDEFQRLEILLTILQAFLGWIFLSSMSLAAYEAVGLFALWVLQFTVPSLREEMLWVYSAWIVIELGLVAIGPQEDDRRSRVSRARGSSRR